MFKPETGQNSCDNTQCQLVVYTQVKV